MQHFWRRLNIVVLVFLVAGPGGCLGRPKTYYASAASVTFGHDGIDASSIPFSQDPFVFSDTTVDEDLARTAAPCAPYRDTYIEPLRTPARIPVAGGKYDGADAPGAAAEGLSIIPRSAWGAHTPDYSRMRKSPGYNRITIHHEGTKTFHKTGWNDALGELKRIQRDHMSSSRKMGDIGYHFLIDPAGRIWQGRSLEYQGAHVRAKNERNIGINVLGNFELQQPGTAQLAALDRLVSHLAAKYAIGPGMILGHSDVEGAQTKCPGRYLKDRIPTLSVKRRIVANRP